jgi:ribosomal protein S11
MAAPAKKTVSKKKKDIKIDSGVLHVQTTSNNTILTLVDANGNTVLG